MPFQCRGTKLGLSVLWMLSGGTGVDVMAFLSFRARFCIACFTNCDNR